MTTMQEAFEQVLGLETVTDSRIADRGYKDTTIEPRGREFVATATKVDGKTEYRAQAIGSTREVAANSLVRTITRP
jgi:hypothetical protein